MRAVQLLRFCQASVLPVILLAHVVAQWLIFPRVHSFRADSGVWAEGLWIAQLILLTGWGVLGPWRWYIRWPLAIGASTYLLWPPSELASDRWFLLSIGAPIVGVVALVLTANWWSGRRLVVLQGPEPPGVPLRFSIRMICLLTALSAVLTRAAIVHRATIKTGMPIEDLMASLSGSQLVSPWFAAGITALALSAVGLLSYWAVLLPGRTWWRLLLMAAAVAMLGSVVPWGGGKEEDTLVMLGWYAATASFVTATLMVLRAVGYRWMKASITGPPSLFAGRKSLATVSAILVLLTVGAIYAQWNPMSPSDMGPLARLICWVEGEPFPYWHWRNITVKPIYIRTQPTVPDHVSLTDPLGKALLMDEKP